MKDMNFNIINNDGLEVKCDVLSLVNADDGTIYVIYTDYTLDESGVYNVYASKMVGEEDNFTLEDIDNMELIPELQKIYEETKASMSLN